MQPDNIRHRAGEKPKRVGVAQIGFLGEGQEADIVEGADVGGCQSFRFHSGSEERDVFVAALNSGAKPLELKGAQLG